MIEEGKLMDNIGEILKNTRLDKGLSLEQVEELPVSEKSI